MVSEIWSVKTYKIGIVEPFKSENDMESFLMNNPAIIGCADPNNNNVGTTLMRQQIYTKKGSGATGRIDLIGLTIIEDDYILRIFELKANKVDKNAVEQLKDYLDGWNNSSNTQVRGNIKTWILKFDLDGINSKNVDRIIENPQGVLIGPDFDNDAIVLAKYYGFLAIKLTRYLGNSNEYYVIIEDLIGDIVKTRQQYGWDLFIKSNLISPNDTFVISNGHIKLRAYPDSKYFHTSHKYLIFDDNSRKLILQNENKILNRIRSSYGSAKVQKWKDIFQSIKNGEGVLISNATEVIYLAFDFPSSYWVPSNYWVHEKTGKTLEELKKLF